MILIHRPGGQGRSTLLDDLKPRLTVETPGFFWQTCLRQIALIDESQLESVRSVLLRGDEIYHADVAYRFILEVICGLHSPLIGETEVFGQFKNSEAEFKYPTNLWGTRLKRFFKVLFEDTKRIRQAYLEDLGSQSYGSVLRRDLKAKKKIQIVGAGQLVEEILPWICDEETQVEVLARNPEKAVRLREKFPKIEIRALDEKLTKADAILVAAPLTAEKLISIFQKAAPGVLLIDLRADSSQDRFELPGSMTIDLPEVFKRLSDNQAVIEDRKQEALKAIALAAHERTVMVEYRPFGWEDVCA